MHSRQRLSIKSATVGGIASSVLLGLAGLTLNELSARDAAEVIEQRLGQKISYKTVGRARARLGLG
jgi:hypothetical protein